MAATMSKATFLGATEQLQCRAVAKQTARMPVVVRAAQEEVRSLSRKPSQRITYDTYVALLIAPR